MFCTQCGCKLEDGYRFCPKCGKAVAGQKNSPRSDLDRIADEIYAECQNDQYKGIEIFRERTNVDLPTARNIMFLRYHGATPNELDAKKKAFRREKYRRIFGSNNCPRCGSKYIESYRKQGILVTAEIEALDGLMFTHPGRIDEGLKCLYCGYTWNPYKKK